MGVPMAQLPPCCPPPPAKGLRAESFNAGTGKEEEAAPQKGKAEPRDFWGENLLFSFLFCFHRMLPCTTQGGKMLQAGLCAGLATLEGKSIMVCLWDPIGICSANRLLRGGVVEHGVL